MVQKFELPDLPYDYSALEPHISGEIMELHHGKHHKTYVTKLNEALEQYAEAQVSNDIAAMISLQSAIKFNGGGHVNHSIFWKNLMPKSTATPTGVLVKAIEKDFGSFDLFKEQFIAKTVAIQGSGWGWLAHCKTRDELFIKTCPNQDLFTCPDLVPLLGIDVWEHAYYLQYKNVRPDYVKAVLDNLVNWTDVEGRFVNNHNNKNI